MLSLDEARKLQAKYQKSAVLKFSVFTVIILAALFLTLNFTDYLTQYASLYAVFAVLLLLAVKFSKIYVLFQHKEFVGTVQYSNLKMEPVKKYNSHQAGTTYQTNDVPMLDLIVLDDKGKKLRKTVEYQWGWACQFPAGSRVAILRFIDQPIVQS